MNPPKVLVLLVLLYSIMIASSSSATLYLGVNFILALSPSVKFFIVDTKIKVNAKIVYLVLNNWALVSNIIDFSEINLVGTCQWKKIAF